MKGYQPLKALCTLMREAAARAVDAAVEGGPPADGGFDGSWLIFRASSASRLKIVSTRACGVWRAEHLEAMERLSGLHKTPMCGRGELDGYCSGSRRRQ